MRRPRIVLSALRGGAGKTLVSLGVTVALHQRGHDVASFKKGPDYIDTGWLALAAGRPCFNLDTFLIDPALVYQSFFTHSADADISVIEGNRGLYDGIDIQGATSTAELAKLIRAPVIMCIDCTKSTRTMAAAVSGCMGFDPDVNVQGVIVNRVAGARHEAILRKCIETFCGVPVVGAVPKLPRQRFPERHMGLIPAPEHAWVRESIQAACDMAEQYIDLDAVFDIASRATALNPPPEFPGKDLFGGLAPAASESTERPKIGVIQDSAFQFYYPENIEALGRAGGEIVAASPLSHASLPDVDALYIGGGFPETHAEQLAENKTFRDQVRDLAGSGLPIYAECGGLMYLGEKLVLDAGTFPMCGVLPIVFGFSKKPQGHGYTVAKVDRKNPFYPEGTCLHGHEFHYSKVLEWRGEDDEAAFAMERGRGVRNRRDGVCFQNVLATYTHIHALGAPGWAGAVVRLADAWRRKKQGGRQLN